MALLLAAAAAVVSFLRWYGLPLGVSIGARPSATDKEKRREELASLADGDDADERAAEAGEEVGEPLAAERDRILSLWGRVSAGREAGECRHLGHERRGWFESRHGRVRGLIQRRGTGR